MGGNRASDGVSGRAGGAMWWWSLAFAAPCDGLSMADGFDFPVGAPEASEYYDAQPFGRNRHLGSDWNARTGGNSDYGDPVWVIADGRVSWEGMGGPGWGRVVKVVHQSKEGCVESLYAHLSEVSVQVGQRVRRGDRMGAIGDAEGQYWAHLHFELRTRAGDPIGSGYGSPESQVNPASFIERHRPSSK